MKDNATEQAYYEYWQQFQDAIGKSVICIIASGDVLATAKRGLPSRDQFLELVGTLGLSESMAGKLIRIAGCQHIFDHCNHLPPKWTTLYELTKLSAARMEDLVATGVINPGCSRMDIVRHLTGPIEPGPPKEKVTEALKKFVRDTDGWQSHVRGMNYVQHESFSRHLVDASCRLESLKEAQVQAEAKLS